MWYEIKLIVAGALALCVLAATDSSRAAPRTLYATPVLSPDRTRTANVTWDDAGFIGVINVTICNTSGTLLHSVTLPEIDPAPADLLWIDDNWVAVESSLGERATGYFYVDARTGRGYLMEIVALASDEEWEFSLATNDHICSRPIVTVAHGRSSLFPILLRDAPWEAHDYFRSEFPVRLAHAADAFVDFRRQCGFRDLEIVSEGEANSELGAVALVRFDDCPEVIYFPTGTTTPLEMFARVQRHPVDIPVLQALEQHDTEIRVRWQNEGPPGSYIVESVSGWVEEDLTTRVVMRGRFEDVYDTPPPPAWSPGVETTETQELHAPPDQAGPEEVVQKSTSAAKAASSARKASVTRKLRKSSGTVKKSKAQVTTSRRKKR